MDSSSLDTRYGDTNSWLFIRIFEAHGFCPDTEHYIAYFPCRISCQEIVEKPTSSRFTRTLSWHAQTTPHLSPLASALLWEQMLVLTSKIYGFDLLQILLAASAITFALMSSFSSYFSSSFPLRRILFGCAWADQYFSSDGSSWLVLVLGYWPASTRAAAL